MFTDGTLMCVWAGLMYVRSFNVPYPSCCSQLLGRIMVPEVLKAKAGLHTGFLSEPINLQVLLICSAGTPFSSPRPFQAQLRCLKVWLWPNPCARVPVYLRRVGKLINHLLGQSHNQPRLIIKLLMYSFCNRHWVISFFFFFVKPVSHN